MEVQDSWILVLSKGTRTEQTVLEHLFHFSVSSRGLNLSETSYPNPITGLRTRVPPTPEIHLVDSGVYQDGRVQVPLRTPRAKV